MYVGAAWLEEIPPVQDGKWANITMKQWDARLGKYMEVEPEVTWGQLAETARLVEVQPMYPRTSQMSSKTTRTSTCTSPLKTQGGSSAVEDPCFDAELEAEYEASAKAVAAAGARANAIKAATQGNAPLDMMELARQYMQPGEGGSNIQEAPTSPGKKNRSSLRGKARAEPMDGAPKEKKTKN